MKLFEFEKNDLQTGYYDPAEDKTSLAIAKEASTLTLKKLNKLKKMREIQRLEDLKRSDLLAVMYGTDGNDSMGGGDMGF